MPNQPEEAKTSEEQNWWICLHSIHCESPLIYDCDWLDDDEFDDSCKTKVNIQHHSDKPTEIQKFWNCTGTMGYVHQLCLSKYLSNKHRSYLNSRATYPWRKYPKISCRLWNAEYKYTIQRNPKTISQRDFTLIFLIIAQLIVFVINHLQSRDSFDTSCNISKYGASNQLMCLNQDFWGKKYSTYSCFYDSQYEYVSIDDSVDCNQSYHQTVIKVIYKYANMLAGATELILIVAGIYTVYQGLKKTILVLPIKAKS